jgi:hypothetical protein
MSLLLKVYKNITNKDTTEDSVAKKDAYSKLFLVALLGILGNFLVSFVLLLIYFGLATKPPPSLVQLNDGSAILTKPVSSLERESVVIERFVADIMGMLYAWTGEYTDKKGKTITDKGVILQNLHGSKTGQVTTIAWEASFAINANFRNEFLETVSQYIPSSVFEGKAQVYLEPIKMITPEKIEEGYWKVTYFTNLIFLDSQRNQTIVPYNIEVYVRAVPVPLNLGSLVKESNSPALANLVFQSRKKGLEIEAIVPYESKDLKPQ